MAPARSSLADPDRGETAAEADAPADWELLAGLAPQGRKTEPDGAASRWNRSIREPEWRRSAWCC